MSRPHNYYSDQWIRKEAVRQDAVPRTPFQGDTSSATTPRYDGHDIAPYVPNLTQYEGNQMPSRNAMYTSTGPRLNPANGFLQDFPLSDQDSGRDPTRSMIMRPPPARSLSYEPVHRMISFDRGEGQLPRTPTGFQSAYSPTQNDADHRPLQFLQKSSGHDLRSGYPDTNTRPQSSASNYPWDSSYHLPQDRLDSEEKPSPKRVATTAIVPSGDERHSKRYRGGRDEFEGSVQYLQKPPRNVPEPRERDLPPLPIHLDNEEQDDILTQVNHRLSQCAFDFIALYRFPIPIEANKPAVQRAADKAWTEWAYLLKRLATKRKIPSHAIFQGQIKELTTVLDNSLEMRHVTKPQPRPLKDDRTVLQFISAGIQVGRILKDAATMEYLDKLYQQTEKVIQSRKEPLSAYR